MRMLDPSDFGLMGMIYFIFTLGNVIINSGFSFSLIRAKNCTDVDFSTIFYVNIIFSIIIYSVVFFTAPFVASFYKQLILTDIIRVYAVIFILSALKTVPESIMMRDLAFKNITFITIASGLIGGIIGLILAYFSFGVWSIVSVSVFSQLFSVLLLPIFLKWKPRKFFSIKVLKKHFAFGYKLTLTNLSDGIVRNLYNVILGKAYTPEIVGYYSKADSLKKLVVTTVSTATNKVTYPILAKMQNDEEAFSKNNKLLIQVVCFLITPILFFLFTYAEHIVLILYTKKWIEIVIYFKILCLSGILYPLSSFNIASCSIKGYSNLVLKAEVVNKVIFLILILFSIQFGIFGLLISTVIFSVIEYIISIYYSNKVIKYGIKQQVLHILPIILTSLLLSLGLSFLDSILININLFYRVVIGFVMFSSMYIFTAYIFKFKSLIFLKSIIINDLFRK